MFYQKGIRVVVFDLIGVLFSIKVWPVVCALGWRNVALYVLLWRKSPIHEGLALLNKMRCEMEGEFQQVLQYKNVYLPNCFLQWQLGHCSNEQVYQALHTYFQHLSQQNYFRNAWHYQLMMNLLCTLLHAGKQHSILRLEKIVSYLVHVVKKKKNYKLFIITNIDQQTYADLQQTYKYFFSLFDGVITSFQAASVKPDPSIFHYFLHTYHILAQDCFFVDDQQENLHTAATLGMRTMRCTFPSLLYFKFLLCGLL